MCTPRVAYIGDRDLGEFRSPLEWLDQNSHLSVFEDLASACDRFAMGDVATLIVVAEQRPGTLSYSAFERLRAAAPLTPVVRLYGGWCEGEMRSGRPWPGAVRVGVRRFVACVGAQLERLQVHGANAWTLPFTRSDEDRSLSESMVQVAGASASSIVLAERRETAAALCDALRSAEFVTHWHRPAEAAELPLTADLFVWDLPAGLGDSASGFARLAERTPGIPKIVVLGFPRASDDNAARVLGAAAVLSKPFLIDDLVWESRQCLRASMLATAAE